ncbi:hypothetical protein OPT61_g5565 [Boeremia exigua]|uniref:Uncharacterized protein n=1 Tax=Boeremia exigua TaxID=749465 RepID=A0ACC2I9Z8_9PLEO|nr:hypothetical protein OPT61_g5565 [Boeremia exigua]
MPTNASLTLLGKTILITGASSGIGRSCAQEFARTCPQDLKLILTARRLDRLHALAGEITAEVGSGVKIHVARLDVAKPADVRALWADLPQGFKDVDVLVNNAGFMSGYERAPHIPHGIIEDVWATNVTGWIGMTQEFLRVARGREGGARGDVVMIGSMAGREAYAGGSVYCASKAAIRSFTDALRRELVATRVRVITVDPGQVLTEFTLIRNRGDEASADKVYESGCVCMQQEGECGGGRLVGLSDLPGIGPRHTSQIMKPTLSNIPAAPSKAPKTHGYRRANPTMARTIENLPFK